MNYIFSHNLQRKFVFITVNIGNAFISFEFGLDLALEIIYWIIILRYFIVGHKIQFLFDIVMITLGIKHGISCLNIYWNIYWNITVNNLVEYHRILQRSYTVCMTKLKLVACKQVP